MAHYRFFPRANAEQDQIWRHTKDRWGEAQAIRYIKGLHAHLGRVANVQALRRRLPRSLSVPDDVKRDMYMSRYERHYIFFRILDNGDLAVLSILHDRMDLPVRLAEDLAMFSARPANDRN